MSGGDYSGRCDGESGAGVGSGGGRGWGKEGEGGLAIYVSLGASTWPTFIRDV